jgi:hypothetical protein
MRPTNTIRIFLVAGLSLAAAACGDAGKARPIDEARPATDARQYAAAPLDTKSRMGVADAKGGAAFHHPPINGAGADAPSGAFSTLDAGGLTWVAPAGWTQGPSKSTRLVTFVPNDAKGVECYVTILGGDAGGVEANVNRWRGQFHLAPLPADAVKALPTVPVLGRQAQMAEIDGGAVGMLGLVCALDQDTVFVKMTGPMDSLRAQRGQFVAFVKSLAR